MTYKQNSLYFIYARETRCFNLITVFLLKERSPFNELSLLDWQLTVDPAAEIQASLSFLGKGHIKSYMCSVK